MKKKIIAEAMGDYIIYHPSQGLLRVKRNLSICITGHWNKHSHILSEKEYLRMYHRKMKISPQ